MYNCDIRDAGTPSSVEVTHRASPIGLEVAWARRLGGAAPGAPVPRARTGRDNFEIGLKVTALTTGSVKSSPPPYAASRRPAVLLRQPRRPQRASSDHCFDGLLLGPATSPKTVFSDMRLPRSLIRPPKPGQGEGGGEAEAEAEGEGGGEGEGNLDAA